jgi:hypothetical protein
MVMVGGLDLHRKQVTFDVVDTETGEGLRGRLAPADRERFRGWLTQFAGQEVDLAVEGCTGWRFVVEECRAAGVRAHLAEPADVAGLKGRRRHAKTDRLDARHLRELLEAGTLPECWIPPAHMLEVRAKVRLYRDLLEERGGWQQRIHATLFQREGGDQERSGRQPSNLRQPSVCRHRRSLSGRPQRLGSGSHYPRDRATLLRCLVPQPVTGDAQCAADRLPR